MRRFAGDQLLVATHNVGKLAEIRDLIAPFGVAVVGAADKGLIEPRETGTTFIENARIKAHAAARTTGLPALADDSGLAVDALEGSPGVYTADWAETGSGRDFGMAMRLVHEKLSRSGCAQPWTAQFRCTLVLAWPDGHDEIFEGVAHGQIVWPMRGAEGHGYDPIFQPDGYTQTFAELSAAEKNQISHRADAFARFVAGCFA